MIDKIVSIGDDKTNIHAKAIVPKNSTIFEGHFPNMPLMPGVLLVETMAQASGYMILKHNEFTQMPFLVGIKDGKLRQFVEPETELDIHAEIEHSGSGFSVAKAKIQSQQKKICDSMLTFKLVDFENKEFKKAVVDRIETIQTNG